MRDQSRAPQIDREEPSRDRQRAPQIDREGPSRDDADPTALDLLLFLFKERQAVFN